MKHAALVLLTLAACSSEDASAPPVGSGHGQCAQRFGSYLFKYTERSGTCGPPGERVVNISAQPTSLEPPCTGKITYSTDNCEVIYDGACPEPSVKGSTLTTAGHSKWSTDAKRGEATEQWTLTGSAGQTLCLSTYDVVITKQ